jgi:SOS-response transcriptional repressor LexA
LAFVKDRQQETGFAASIQETAAHFGFKSPNSVRQHLRLMRAITVFDGDVIEVIEGTTAAGAG